MTRLALLYSPAGVCGALAVIISIYGRSDGIVIGGAAALAVAMLLHTLQEVRDRGVLPEPDPRVRWLPERWYRDVWLLLISVVVVLAAFNADSLAERIQTSRVDQARQSCRERNEERALFRDKLTDPLVRYFKGQRKQTERIPRAAFEQFRPITKKQALARVDRAVRGLKDARRELHPLNCRARARAVRNAAD